MTDSVRSYGGVAGEVAVTEDLERGSRIVDSVALLLEEASRSLGEAEAYSETAARSGLESTRSAAEQASQALWDAQFAVRAAGPTTLRAKEMSEALRLTAQYFLEGEQRAMAHVSSLTRASLAARSIVGTGWWHARQMLSGAVFTATTLGPLGAFGLSDNLAGAVRPEGLPPTTGFINRDTVQLSIANLDGSVLGYGLQMYALAAAMATLEGLFGEGHATTVRERTDSHDARSPRSLEDVMHGILVEQARGDGTVSVETITHADGTRVHIVTIPGTQDWSLSDDNPFDNEANLSGVNGGTSDAQMAIVDAMRAAGIQPGDEVMLAGHSQGGINAVALASRPEFLEEFNVTHIVTAGSPVGRMDLPPSINMLQLEHTEDIVSGLEGMPNPATPTRTTVQRDLLLSGDPRMETLGRDITGAHHLVAYGSTAGLVDSGLAGTSASAWKESASAFFTGEPSTLTEYLPVVPPPPPAPEPLCVRPRPTALSWPATVQPNPPLWPVSVQPNPPLWPPTGQIPVTKLPALPTLFER